MISRVHNIVERECVKQPIHASNTLYQVPNQHLLASTRQALLYVAGASIIY